MTPPLHSIISRLHLKQLRLLVASDPPRLVDVEPFALEHEVPVRDSNRRLAILDLAQKQAAREAATQALHRTTDAFLGRPAQRAQDLLTNAPSEVDEKQLRELHIRLRNEPKVA